MFDIDKLYTPQEFALAETVPLTPEILTEAVRMGTGGLSWFGYDVINPLIGGLLKPTEQEEAIIATFSRLIALVRTCWELGQPHQFQSVAAGARAIFELCIDAALLCDPKEGARRAAQYHGHTLVARYRAAQKLMNFYAQHPKLHDPADTEPQRELLAKPGIDVELETLAQSLWGVRWTSRLTTGAT